MSRNGNDFHSPSRKVTHIAEMLCVETCCIKVNLPTQMHKNLIMHMAETIKPRNILTNTYLVKCHFLPLRFG